MLQTVYVLHGKIHRGGRARHHHLAYFLPRCVFRLRPARKFLPALHQLLPDDNDGHYSGVCCCRCVTDHGGCQRNPSDTRYNLDVLWRPLYCVRQDSTRMVLVQLDFFSALQLGEYDA